MRRASSTRQRCPVASHATVTDPNPASWACSSAQSSNGPSCQARHSICRRASTRESWSSNGRPVYGRPGRSRASRSTAGPAHASAPAAGCGYDHRATAPYPRPSGRPPRRMGNKPDHRIRRTSAHPPDTPHSTKGRRSGAHITDIGTSRVDGCPETGHPGNGPGPDLPWLGSCESESSGLACGSAAQARESGPVLAVVLPVVAVVLPVLAVVLLVARGRLAGRLPVSRSSCRSSCRSSRSSCRSSRLPRRRCATTAAPPAISPARRSLLRPSGMSCTSCVLDRARGQ